MGTGTRTERASLMVCGQTHVPRVVSVMESKNKQPITIVNPGSVGLPTYDDAHPIKHNIETGSSTHATPSFTKPRMAGKPICAAFLTTLSRWQSWPSSTTGQAGR
jgi:hypothetical protein